MILRLEERKETEVLQIQFQHSEADIIAFKVLTGTRMKTLITVRTARPITSNKISILSSEILEESTDCFKYEIYI